MASAKKIRLGTIEDHAMHGYTHKFVVKHSDLSAAATTETVQLLDDMIAGMVIEKVAYKVITQFDGGATSELVVDVGLDLDAGSDDPDKFIDAVSVHADATPVDYSIGTGTEYILLEGASLEVLFTATGANISVLDAGEIHIFARIIDINKV